ncbi:MAG: hypothetical protein LWX23_09480 [Spirochaetia bacterium]|nr:hypothetical protein [Spirochaetia bacterium]MCE1209683.1 hypothetical protein [Spirochaetia bacterium]
MQRIMEPLFDLAYLGLVITVGVIMMRRGKENKQYGLFGLMAVVLGSGDAFHLVPRVYALLTTGLDRFATALGIGRMVTSITMTVFYLILYRVWRLRYKIQGKTGLTAVMYLLACARIVLSSLPQNGWTSARPPLSWGVYRNIPFALMGVIMIFIFYAEAKHSKDKAFGNIWLAVLLSFAFYLPVVLWSDALPLVGVLMIPKTCAYVWLVFIGYAEMRKKEAVK